MDFSHYTDKAQRTLQSAQALALRSNHQKFAPEHLFAALLSDDTLMIQLLIAAGGKADQIQADAAAALKKIPEVQGAGAGQLYLTPEMARVLEVAEKAAKDFASAEKKTEVSWHGPRAIIAKNRVKLLLNLFLVAYSSIPRGGSLDVTLENPETDACFKITAKGRMLRVPSKYAELLAGQVDEAIDAHSIQPYYTVLLADECGMHLDTVQGEGEIVFSATVA